ncbi:MAG TPA: hypothetical protein VK445_09905, partial [Dissulfurispiraceae bacterium]|nr:hypothetical protein [Dissulfurispiraceae bacterium]
MLADKPNEVKDIWNRFVQENILDDHSVRPHIARSWERCRSLHIDPLHNSTSDVRGLELRELRRSMRHLLDICRPVMADINRAISGSGFQIVLSDERGVLLETMGDPSVIRRTRQVQLCPGGNWNESIKGTNAIGTVLAEGIPLQVHAAEHFC